MHLVLAELQEGISLLTGNVALVALNKHEKCLVPQDRKLTLLRSEPEEVEDQGINHTVGKGVFLVLNLYGSQVINFLHTWNMRKTYQKYPEEDGVCSCVLHFRDLQHDGTGMQDGD